MYDTLKCLYHNEYGTSTGFLQTIPQNLTTVITEGTSLSGQFVSGYLDNLKIIITDDKVRITEGSICKYYLGDNFKTLSRNDTRRAFEKISDQLNLSFNKASVYAIDFGRNIVLKHPEELYYNHLGVARYYQRLEQTSGLYYSNSKRVLAFYGKVKEQKQKRQIIPEIYQNCHLLRYEIRLRRSLSKQLNLPLITVENLWSEELYSTLIQKWKNEYNNIIKVHYELQRMKPTGSVKSLQRQLAALHMSDIGFDKYLKLIKEWQLKGLITKKQANDQRKFILSLIRIKPGDKSNELINELTKKISEAARQY